MTPLVFRVQGCLDKAHPGLGPARVEVPRCVADVQPIAEDRKCLFLHMDVLYVCLFNHELYMIEYCHIFSFYKRKGKDTK